MRIRVGERQWDGSFEQFGVSAGVEMAVDEAFAVSGSLSWIARAYHRLTDNPVERSFTLEYRTAASPSAPSWRGRPPAPSAARDAAIWLEDGEVEHQRAQGQALTRPPASARSWPP
jgi:hypothetical protein